MSDSELMKSKIAVVGLGYVGISNAAMFAQHNEVACVDIDETRVATVNARKSPVQDADLSEFLSKEKLNLWASTNLNLAVDGAEYLLVCTPTNYNEKTNFFDTSSVEAVIEQALEYTPSICVVIKSTIPVGFVDRMRYELNTSNIFFCPEFLCEGTALRDNLYPSRIVVGDNTSLARNFAKKLSTSVHKKNVNILFTGTREAEAIKLFSNTYLAMRVAFFNELDSFAIAGDLDSRSIIEGVSLDERIGNYYNNPSFGYGGYCLPKDTKQLLVNYDGIPQNLIRAIVDANTTRKDFLSDIIINMQPKIVGVFRLVMKAKSDNFRESSVQRIMDRLQKNGIEVIIYEPKLKGADFYNFNVEVDLDRFKKNTDIILANRLDACLNDVREKVFTRDIFGVS